MVYMKRFLLILVCLSLLFTCVGSVTATADINPDYKPPEKPKEEYTYSVANGEVSLMYRCSYSTTFGIPETIEGYPVTKVEFGNAFVDDVLRVLYIPKTVKTISSSINYGNRGLQTIVVDEENPYFSSVDGVLYNKDKTVLFHYPAMKKGAVKFESTMTEIGESAFYQCNGITAVIVPDGITSIKESTFSSNHSLVSVELPDSLENIEPGAFGGCISLKQINLPEGLKTIGYGAFRGCISLQNIVFPESLTHIAERAFFHCKNLDSVILPKGLVEIGELAFGYIDYSTLCCIYWEANPNFTIYGYKNTLAMEYAEWEEPAYTESGVRLPVFPKFNFIPLDYFTDPDHPPLAGDVDADENCSATDALYVLKNVVGKHSFHQSQIPVADMDGDGNITAADALEILRSVVGKIPSFPEKRV